jgi:hypothetical protein
MRYGRELMMEAPRTGQAQMTIPASKAVNYAVRVYRLEGYCGTSSARQGRSEWATGVSMLYMSRIYLQLMNEMECRPTAMPPEDYTCCYHGKSITTWRSYLSDHYIRNFLDSNTLSFLINSWLYTLYS